MVLRNIQNCSQSYPGLSYQFFCCFLSSLIIIATHIWGSRPYPIQNVNKVIGYKFSRWQRIIGLPSFWSQFRLTIASGILIISIIIYHGIITSYDIWHFTLSFIVATDIILQFYVATGDIRNSLNRSIAQIMVTLSRQIDLTLKETHGLSSNRLRMRILILDPKYNKFNTKYEYGMEGEPDMNLQIGVNQGIAGRVFAEGRPYMRTPYNPEELGFSSEQLKDIPTSIRWKMGLPLIYDHKPFGVLAIDCDFDLSIASLGKILDYTLGIANSLSILLSQFPSQEIQMAIPYQK